MSELLGTAILEWIDELPPPGDKKQKRRGLGILLIRDLKERPGHWARIDWSTGGAKGLIQLGRVHGVKVEVVMRQGDMYARYMGGAEDE